MKKETVKKGVRVLEGALVGAALGAGAALFAASKAAKKVGEKVKKTSADFYRYLSPQLKKVKAMTQAQYKTFATAAAKRYAKDKKLTESEMKKLVKDAEGSWKHLKKNL